MSVGGGAQAVALHQQLAGGRGGEVPRTGAAHLDAALEDGEVGARLHRAGALLLLRGHEARGAGDDEHERGGEGERARQRTTPRARHGVLRCGAVLWL